jgi:hypothetical protein
MNIESMRFGDTSDLLAPHHAFRVLPSNPDALDVRLHFRKLGKGHILETLLMCHIRSPRKLSPAQHGNA